MKSIIEEIYYGNRGDYNTIKAGEKYFKVKERYCEIHDKLEEGLNEEQKQLLDDLFIQSGGLEGEFACSHFKEGFKLGMLVAFEVLGE